MASGLQLQQAYDRAVQIDKAIEAKHPYAFDETGENESSFPR